MKMMEKQTLVQDNTQTQLQHILQLLQAQQHAKTHDDDTAHSPQLKNQRTQYTPSTPIIMNVHIYDHPMTDDSHEEVGTS